MVELGVVQPVEQVDAARTGGGEADAETAGALGVARGHECGGFLVVHEHEADAVAMAAQALHDPVDAVAREAEDGVDAPVREPFDQQLRRDRAHAISSRSWDKPAAITSAT